jgi:hypothetical protein
VHRLCAQALCAHSADRSSPGTAGVWQGLAGAVEGRWRSDLRGPGLAVRRIRAMRPAATARDGHRERGRPRKQDRRRMVTDRRGASEACGNSPSSEHLGTPELPRKVPR